MHQLISFNYSVGRVSDHSSERTTEHYLNNDSFKKNFVDFLSRQIYPVKTEVNALIHNRYDSTFNDKL